MTHYKLLASISKLNWIAQHDECFTSDAKILRCKCGSVFWDGIVAMVIPAEIKQAIEKELK